VGGDILSLAVCVCDVVNKAGVCCRSVHYVTSRTFLLSLVKSKPACLRPDELGFEALLPKYVEQLTVCTKPADENVFTFSTLSG